MTRFIKQVLISVDALLLMVYVYLFKQIMSSNSNVTIIVLILSMLSFGLILLLSCLLLQFCLYDSSDVVNNIAELQEVTNEYMYIYFAYIFVAVIISNNKTFIMVFLILLLILFKTQIVAFNPIFCLLGYHYYRIKTSQNPKSIDVFVISKRKNIKDYSELQFNDLSKINEFTYIDKEV